MKLVGFGTAIDLSTFWSTDHAWEDKEEKKDEVAQPVPWTRYNRCVGEALFAAPEMYATRDDSTLWYEAFAADVWSIGAVLAALLFPEWPMPPDFDVTVVEKNPAYLYELFKDRGLLPRISRVFSVW